MNISFEQIFDYLVPYIIPVIMWTLTVTITFRLITKKQSVSATLSWLMIVYLIPIVGILAYLVIGEINLGKRRGNSFKKLQPKFMAWFEQFKTCGHLINTNNNLLYKPIFELAQNRLGIPCVLGNELHIYDTPESIMQSIIQDINQAQTSINMTFYIWFNGGMVDEVMQALVKARQRGVAIHILLDSVGSRAFFKSQNYQYMRQQGIEITEALHVSLLRVFLRRIDLRQHRKIIVIDNQIAYTGSMNMVDPSCFKQDAHVGKWIDIMVRITGPVSSLLNALHAWDWEIESEKALPLILPACPEITNSQSHSHAVQLIASGPSFPDDLMAQSLSLAIFSARKSITITTPYFVPSHGIVEALRIAALRGVEVNLIIPKRNDSVMVKWASRSFFDELLSVGVKIYQFEKGLLHTKSMLIDNKLALVGTVNMDMRSFMLNFEVTMVVEDKSFANEIAILHENYLQTASLLDYQQWKTRSLYSRIVEKIFFLFSPLL
ncbi:cardiolipin synthase [Volucribacter psittacicida]|uniref:Cardiolipin synthase A n=1 Tax=Volucribacter psittacicida TaxID=203482 RepID=A0A4R1G1R0_9PAST|nr:cardiolipin synthase [Volucribacter psittacicida]TCK01584.1 cardiolipin synthase [Volucribacter psittacicida]